MTDSAFPLPAEPRSFALIPRPCSRAAHPCATWTDVFANLPDVPATSVKTLPDGTLALGTDLAAFYRAPGRKN